ncbi:MAG TPA: hypothetical protein PLK12_07230 [Prolixibacteraceae bacterium]|nr:hypothetical protein [Prolixibacteraceae bacterium]
MKRIITFVLVLFVAVVLRAQPQSVIERPSGGSTIPPLSAGYEVPSGSVFSYVPVNPVWAFASIVENNWKCFQSFSGATGPFNVVTIWILGYTADPREVLVDVYQPGATPTTLVQSTTVIAQLTDTELDFGSWNIYECTMNIPTVSMSAGWVSVQATTYVSDYFYWLGVETLPMLPALQDDGSSVTDLNSVYSHGLSLCLSSSKPVPFPYWAIAVVFVLVAGVVVFRFRRRIA